MSAGQTLNIPSPQHVASAQKTEQLGRKSLRPSAKANIPPARIVATAKYKVRAGDTLSSIARTSGITVAQLKQINRIAGNNIQAGQTLNIARTTVAHNSKAAASNSKKPTYYRVKNGDSLYVIAKRYNISLQQLQAWNPKSSKNIRPGQQLAIYR